MNELLLIFGMMVVTFGVRYPVLALVGRLELPDIVVRGLRYVPPVVLTAITVPAVLMPKGTLEIGLQNTHLIAGVAAVLIAWRSKNLLATIVIGMILFLLLRTILPMVSAAA